MNTARSIFLWTFLALCLGLSAMLETVSLKDSKDRLDAFPRSGFGFVAKEIPITPLEASVFKGCNLLKLQIHQENMSYFLTAIDGTHNRSAVHDARLCFIGSGWTILEEKSIRVPGGDATVLTLGRDSERKQVMMWFTDGRKRYGSALRYWTASALRRLSFGASGEEPIRVILQPNNNTEVDWNTTLIKLFPLWSL